MFTVYVIESPDGKHYTGHTSDIDRRLQEHNNHFSHSTMHLSNWKIVYTEFFETRSQAMKREKYLKSGRGRQELKDLIVGWSPPEAE